VNTPFEVWLKVIGTNLNGVFLCSKEALRIMREQKNGSIINISSLQGKRGDPLRGPYCASKFAVEGLTEVMAKENSAYNVRVNALSPGGRVAVEWQQKKSSNKGSTMLSPNIIRDCAVYLASDESSNITGQHLDAMKWNQQNGIDVRWVEI
jgi:3-oxoacyl-[acyl-carrier protein] reductase